jgi:hypothetical protein
MSATLGSSWRSQLFPRPSPALHPGGPPGPPGRALHRGAGGLLGAGFRHAGSHGRGPARALPSRVRRSGGPGQGSGVGLLWMGVGVWTCTGECMKSWVVSLDSSPGVRCSHRLCPFAHQPQRDPIQPPQPNCRCARPPPPPASRCRTTSGCRCGRQGPHTAARNTLLSTLPTSPIPHSSPIQCNPIPPRPSLPTATSPQDEYLLLDEGGLLVEEPGPLPRAPPREPQPPGGLLTTRQLGSLTAALLSAAPSGFIRLQVWNAGLGKQTWSRAWFLA